MRGSGASTSARTNTRRNSTAPESGPAPSAGRLRRGHPVAQLAVPFVLEHTTVALDHPARREVVVVAGQQDPLHPEITSNHQGRCEHRGRVTLTSSRAADVVPDVAADLGQPVVELV